MSKLANEFEAVLRELLPTIADEYRASDDPEDTEPGICITFGAHDRKPGKDWQWSFQTGDNSYSGSAYHYPHWGVVSLYRDSDVEAVANDAAEQILELCASR